MSKNLNTKPCTKNQAGNRAGLFGLAGYLEAEPKHLSEQGVGEKPFPIKKLSQREIAIVAFLLSTSLGRPEGETVH
jgi:hypothetical protein